MASYGGAYFNITGDQRIQTDSMDAMGYAAGTALAAEYFGVPVLAIGVVTFDAMTLTSIATVVSTASYPGGMLGHGLLPRNIVGQSLISRSLLKYRP